MSYRCAVTLSKEADAHLKNLAEMIPMHSKTKRELCHLAIKKKIKPNSNLPNPPNQESARHITTSHGGISKSLYYIVEYQRLYNIT
jgi:hypothetical protein